MDNEIKPSENTGGSIRLIGRLILILGIILLVISQFMEITVEPDYSNINIDASQNFPEKVVNLGLIANKINLLILGGLLILIGLKLSLVTNKTILGIKKQSKK